MDRALPWPRMLVVNRIVHTAVVKDPGDRAGSTIINMLILTFAIDGCT